MARYAAARCACGSAQKRACRQRRCLQNGRSSDSPPLTRSVRQKWVRRACAAVRVRQCGAVRNSVRAPQPPDIPTRHRSVEITPYIFDLSRYFTYEYDIPVAIYADVCSLPEAEIRDYGYIAGESDSGSDDSSPARRAHAIDA